MSKQLPYALTNFSLLTGHTAIQPIDAIIISGKKITGLARMDDIPEGVEQFDLKGHTVSPGFIDLQLNGCGGVLLNSDISTQTLDIMHSANLRSGCTTFLPTLITCSDNDMHKAVKVVRHYTEQYPERTPGIHLEGPYLNKARKGIHNEQFIRKPSDEMIDFMCRNADVIAMITLAPEVCPESVIERLNQAGIVVSLGHTDATFDQVQKAEDAGARFVTHLFNGMSQLTHREPGVIGGVFASEQLGAGIIADGYHLDWSNLLLARRLLNDRLVLVTDATPAAGSDMTEFEFAGQTIYHQNGKCTGKDGTLGGSALTMIEAVVNSITAGIDKHDAIRMATANPAMVINTSDKMGEIALGYYANLAIFDQHFKMQGSVSGGNLEFHGL